MSKFDKNISVLFLSLAAVFGFAVEDALATAASFTVNGGGEVTKFMDLTVEDRVFIRFNVVGLPDNTVDFSIVYPNGTLRDFGLVGDFSFSFVCDVEGRYVLQFSNVYSSGEKFVSLDYEIEHYVFGLPEMLFLTVVIVVVCVAAVAAFVLMGKPR
ncbi:MAG: emp24/gp25L/p24 family protein [Candidatus Bathyarchaeia archaeon]